MRWEGHYGHLGCVDDRAATCGLEADWTGVPRNQVYAGRGLGLVKRERNHNKYHGRVGGAYTVMRNFTRLWRASVAPTPILLLASDSGNTIVSRQKTASWLLRVRHCYRDHLPVQLPQVTREHIAHLQ